MSETSYSTVELGKIVSRDPEIHSGDLVFTATRVPVDTLVDYLKSDHSIEQFLKDFPTVERWQVESYLEVSPEGSEEWGLAAHRSKSLRSIRNNGQQPPRSAGS